MNALHSLLRPVLVACWCLTIAGSATAAQGPEKPKPRKQASPDSQPRPTRKPATPGRNLADMLGGGGGWEDPAPAPTTSAEGAPTASPGSSAPSAVESEISSLEKRIETAKRIAAKLERDPSSVPPVGTLATMLAKAADYRRRYELMRERLYVSEPGPGSPVVDSIAAFIGRWGALGGRIQPGTRESARLTPSELEIAGSRLREWTCPLGVEVLDGASRGGLSGRAWACLSDSYFADLARQEAATNDALFAARDVALAPLAGALRELDGWRRAQEAPRSASDALRLEGEFSVRLHKVYLAGITARHAELTRIRDAQKESLFHRFVARSTAVSNPTDWSASGLLVATGRQLRATLGSTRTTVQVVASPAADGDADLARRLHDIHYRLSTLDAEVSAADREKLRDEAVQLAVDLATDPMVENPRALPAFKSGMQQKETALLANRPARVLERRQGIESQRITLLQRIANR